MKACRHSQHGSSHTYVTIMTHTHRYGEMVVSALYELPPNRQQVETRVVDDDGKGRLHVQDAIKEELAAGVFACVVCVVCLCF